MIKRIKIFDVNLCDFDYKSLLRIAEENITRNSKVTIGYCTAHVLNLAYTNFELKSFLNSFDYQHIDGIGAFIASKILFGRKGFTYRITGSDFYPLLISKGIKNSWSFYFFGDTTDVLNKIKLSYPLLNINGVQSGYNFNNNEVIKEINEKHANILVVGLGTPLQEEWIIKNKESLNVNFIITVGSGIKVFAGTKVRGPLIIRRLGLEWLVRLITNLAKMWKRYLFGIPLFLLRVILNKIKMMR